MELHHRNATGRPRRLRIAGAVAVLAAGLGLLVAAPAAAQDEAGRRGILVVQVEGLIDAPNETLVRDAIEKANDQELTLLVLQIDAPGAIVDVQPIVRAIGRSKVPVAAWVGPSGADAEGAAALLVESAHVAYVSQGSSLGPAHPVRLDDPDAVSASDVRSDLADLAAARGREPDGADRLATRALSPARAADVGATDGVRAILGEVIVKLDGKTVETAVGDVELSTAKVIGEGRERRRQPNQDVVFETLGLGGQIQHALISPSAAYFLLVAGFALIVFEFFAASVGFAGVVGAIAVVGAFYGFSHLPTHWWAVGVLIVSGVAYAVDAQAGGLGFWTGVGTVALVIGSLTLYGGDSALRPAWWLLLVVGLGTVAFYLFAVPTFIRSRFSTPTLGREGMIGEEGTAEVPVDPDGVVLVRGARWRARTNRATPVAAGDTVRVVSVEGVVLEVEPESGAAVDYRDKARERKARRGKGEA